jgi:predicted  nucleic acid-binding Zn-ribbon protein
MEKLERERDEWKAKYIDLKSQLTQTHGCVTISRNGYVQELERELAEAREETIRTREFMDYGFAKAQEELATVTEQRDRLAVALKETISSYDVVTESIPSLCSDYVHNVIAPLLAAVKG